jgi:hypothetical protein
MGGSRRGMGYKFLGMLVWNGGKWFTRRKLSDTSGPQRAGFATGLAAIAALSTFLLARKAGNGD